MPILRTSCGISIKGRTVSENTSSVCNRALTPSTTSSPYAFMATGLKPSVRTSNHSRNLESLGHQHFELFSMLLPNSPYSNSQDNRIASRAQATVAKLVPRELQVHRPRLSIRSTVHTTEVSNELAANVKSLFNVRSAKQRSSSCWLGLSRLLAPWLQSACLQS